MSADVIAWLRSEEGEAWSRARSAASTTDSVPWMASPLGSQDAAEDPTGGPPTEGPALIAVPETAATGMSG